ncbi:LysM domain-containing protein [Leucothrix sargassi]|nr:LysM domain-containing protein [Leucothrix sargassi]
MKTLSTVVVGTLLAIGLAGNAAAAPNQYTQGNGAKKVVIVKTSAKKAAQNKKIKTYTVRRGDTLSRIAARNHTSVKQLIKLNSLSAKQANNLRVGMKLRVS